MTHFDDRRLRFSADHLNGGVCRMLDAWVQLAQKELLVFDVITHHDQAHHAKLEIPDERVPVAIPQPFHEDAHLAAVVVMLLADEQWPPPDVGEDPRGECLAGRLQAQPISLEARDIAQAVGKAHLWSNASRQQRALRPRSTCCSWNEDSSTLDKGALGIRCATLPRV